MKSGRSKLHAYSVACSDDYAPTSHKLFTGKESFTAKRPPLADLILAAKTDEEFWLAFEAEHKQQSQLPERSSYSAESRLEQSSCGEENDQKLKQKEADTPVASMHEFGPASA